MTTAVGSGLMSWWKADSLDPCLFLLAKRRVSVKDGHDQLALDVREVVEVDELRVGRVLTLTERLLQLGMSRYQ